ncbi:MAG: ergothioneine biosynthesis protein EgtB [Gammaproteobacteria bacterium]|nr:ergothioneine biosynthesis protein EgtB [Gammaproteobacteria bacterium]
MNSSLPEVDVDSGGNLPAGRYRQVRARTESLIRGLAPEDTVVQSMPDVSPTKWHLAHTTWFFEQFLLAAFQPAYERFHAGYEFLFNSYYQQVGPMFERARRGLISRPTLAEVLDYRHAVDAAMQELLAASGNDPRIAEHVTLGCNHEQQHQELLVTDIKHVLARNPLTPAWRELPAPEPEEPAPVAWREFAGGVVEVGHGGEGFAYDNELPRHRVFLEPYALAQRPVANAEYRAFMEDGGYRRPELWLADGWARVQEERWARPLYWSEDDEREFTVAGLRGLEPAAPVAHLSHYEADAYARWAGARLPTEAEWEQAASAEPIAGNLAEAERLHPQPPGGASLAGLWGDVWEWTSSAYLPYPGYRAPEGAIGEYNGKFMSGQMVLRGGSCATPRDHIRATYRNFFYPGQRWQFSGLRLARDA